MQLASTAIIGKTCMVICLLINTFLDLILFLTHHSSRDNSPDTGEKKTFTPMVKLKESASASLLITLAVPSKASYLSFVRLALNVGNAITVMTATFTRSFLRIVN